MKLCIDSRHELRIVPLDRVVMIKADGNYCDFFFSDGTLRTELSCLSLFENRIHQLYNESARLSNPFYRLGRSYLVNMDYVTAINLRTRRLLFHTSAVPGISAPREALQALKKHLKPYLQN